MTEQVDRPLEPKHEPYELIRVYDAISNIDYPGCDSVEWTHKAKKAALELMEWAREDARRELTLQRSTSRDQFISDGINKAVEAGLGPHPLPDSYCLAVQRGVDAVIASRPNTSRDMAEQGGDVSQGNVADEHCCCLWQALTVEEVTASGKAILTDLQMFELVAKALLRGSFGWYSETFQQAHDAWFRWKVLHDDRVRSAERERLLEGLVTRAGVEAGARRLFVYDTAAAGDAEGAWGALPDDAPLRAIYRTRARAVLEAAAREPSDG